MFFVGTGKLSSAVYDRKVPEYTEFLRNSSVKYNLEQRGRKEHILILRLRWRQRNILHVISSLLWHIGKTSKGNYASGVNQDCTYGRRNVGLLILSSCVCIVLLLWFIFWYFEASFAGRLLEWQKYTTWHYIVNELGTKNIYFGFLWGYIHVQDVN